MILPRDNDKRVAQQHRRVDMCRQVADKSNRDIDALMTERAVTRAAGRIGLSQPAMSHALSRLRGLFADELFVRAAIGMEPTARAREIAPLVTAAIEHIEAALRLGVGFDPGTSAATFTAGMAEYAEVALVGPLARAFAREAPDATLRLLPATGRGLVEQLEHGAIERLQQVQVDSADIHGTNDNHTINRLDRSRSDRYIPPQP